MLQAKLVGECNFLAPSKQETGSEAINLTQFEDKLTRLVLGWTCKVVMLQAPGLTIDNCGDHSLPTR